MLVKIVTGSGDETNLSPGTDGDVYLGICGREFSIDSEADDFESGLDRTYILGKDPDPPITGIDIQRVRYRDENDPRKPNINTDNLYKYPVYLRFEPKDRDDNWQLQYVHVYVNPRGGEPFFTYHGLELQDDYLWLGTHYGKYCYLHRTSPPVPASLPNGTRGL